MAHEIVWTTNAEDDFREIIEYLLDDWADDFAEKFGEQVNKALSLLETYPFLGVVTNEFSSVRKIAINRQYSLYYIVLRQQIVIVNLYQNSRNKN